MQDEPNVRAEPEDEISVSLEQADAEASAAVTHAVAEAIPLAELPCIDGERDPAQVEDAEELDAAEPELMLERKHPLAIRWMHWINFPVLFTMIWSGLLIYWNDSDNAYQHPHAVYRVGVGSLTLARMFPPWFWKTINAPYRVTEGLGYHFFFMWIFAINGILYVTYLLISGEWRVLIPQRRSFVDAIRVTLVDLHILKSLPPQGKYNGAQRIAYTAVVLMGLGSLGIIYPSVRREGGTCLACFRPSIVANVRKSAPYQLIWTPLRAQIIRQEGAATD